MVTKNKFSLLSLLILSFLVSFSFISASAGPSVTLWLNESDNFYSFAPGNNIITLYANVTNSSVLMRQIADFSNITPSCGNVTFNFVSGNTYLATCNVNSVAAVSNFNPAVIITYFLDMGGMTVSTQSVVLYNMTVPPMTNPCSRFGSGTTNLSQINDFQHVDFTTEIEINGSSACNNISLPWGNNFQKVITLTYTDLNFSDPNIGSSLALLGSAIRPYITPPNQFGDSYIYVNSSAFSKLNTSANVTMYGLPFATVPSLSAEGDGSSNVISFVLGSPYIINGTSVPNSTLTFSVNHFSQYNITDSFDPTIAYILPSVSNVSTSTTNVTVRINGTGTQIYNVSISVNGTQQFYTQGNSVLLNCSNQTLSGDVIICSTLVSLTSGANLISVKVNDLGGISGNWAGVDYTLEYIPVVDSVAPVIVLSGTASGVIVNDTTLLRFKATDNIDTNITCILYRNSAPLYTYYAPNNTFQDFQGIVNDGNYTWFVNCSDDAGNFNVSETRNFTSDRTAPFFIGFTPSGNVTENYSGGFSQAFTIVLNETITPISSAILNFNGVNYSMSPVSGTTYQATVSDISAGNYTYYYRVNDSARNVNTSAIYSYIINQVNGEVQVYLNGTTSGMVIPVNTNISLNATLITGSGSIQFYKNGTLIYNGSSPYAGNITNFTSAGLYNLTAIYSGNNNYTSSISTLWVNVYASNTTNTLVNTTNTTITGNQTQVVVSNVSLLGNVTIPLSSNISSNQTISLDLSALMITNNASSNVTLTNNVTLLREGNVTVTIPANTNITGSSSWNGILTLPTINLSSFSAPSGSTNVVIDLGSSYELNFSSPVKIVLTGMANKSAAWSRGSSTLNAISLVCNSNSSTPTNINSSARECYIDSADDNDLIIWTYHFTTFAAYTPSSDDSSSGGNTGGSSGGSSTVSTEGLPLKDISNGLTINLSSSNKIIFNVVSENHSLTLVGVDLNTKSATIKLQSTLIYATLAVGETQEFDLNEDGKKDISVKLEGIGLNNAVITVKSLYSAVVVSNTNQTLVTDQAGLNVTYNDNKSIVDDEVKKDSLKYLIIGGIILLVLIIFFYIRYKRSHIHGVHYIRY